MARGESYWTYKRKRDKTPAKRMTASRRTVVKVVAGRMRLS